MDDTVYLKLDEAQFKALVTGQEAVLQTRDGAEVRMILEDMGWERMLSTISEARKAARGW